MHRSDIKFILVSAALAQGCAPLGDDDTLNEENVGSLSAGLSLGELAADVTAVRFAVVSSERDCSAAPIASTTVRLEGERLPGSLAAGAGSLRRFADARFVLAAGHYRLCATPLANEQPSSSCAPAEAEAEVVPSTTQQVRLTSACSATDRGGLDVVLALNQPPVITHVTLDPSGFISVCEALSIQVEAEDPNDDPLQFAFALSAGSADAHLRSDGAQASFSGPPGDYTLAITVADVHGQSASLSIPVHVSDATCAVPPEVQAIFSASCGGCHTTSSAGGLSLANAEASYANLVARGATAAACAGRVRVVPGDPAQSYLMAKLRGDADICGVQMPRGRPPLSAGDMATLTQWIAELPH